LCYLKREWDEEEEGGREKEGKEGSIPRGFLQHPQFELSRNKPGLHMKYGNLI
jgi:hypothetical protein